MERTRLLRKEEPLELHAVFSEQALRLRVGSKQVMNEQYRHLLAMAELANVTVQVVADPNDAAQMATANTYKQETENYWNGRTESGKNNETISFNFAITIVAPGQQKANTDTLTVVNGTGRSNVQMTLGPTSIPDTGTLYTNDNTGNPSGMAGIGPHESGHLLGLRDMYSPGETVGYNATPTVDIMRYAQPTNGVQTAFMMLSPANLNKTIQYRPCPHQPCP